MYVLFLFLSYYSYTVYLYFCLLCVCVCVCAQSLSHVPLFVTTWTVVHQAPLSTEFFRQEYWNMFSFSTLGMFPTQGSNPGFLCLLYWQADSLPQRYLGSPDTEVPHWIFCQCRLEFIIAFTFMYLAIVLFGTLSLLVSSSIMTCIIA